MFTLSHTHTHSHASTPPPRTTSTHATSTHPHPQSIHPTLERVRVRAQMATPSYVSVAALLHMPTCACTCAIVSQTFMRAKHVGSVTHSVAQAPAHRFGHALETFVFATMLAETGPRAPRGQHWVAAGVAMLTRYCMSDHCKYCCNMLHPTGSVGKVAAHPLRDVR